jgi:hypothetical protein
MNNEKFNIHFVSECLTNSVSEHEMLANIILIN